VIYRGTQTLCTVVKVKNSEDPEEELAPEGSPTRNCRSYMLTMAAMLMNNK
jgi:hypothetical protein